MDSLSIYTPFQFARIVKWLRNDTTPQPLSLFPNRSFDIDKDRIAGSANQAKGAIKEAAGKLTGDAKLKAEGAADKAKGQVQNAIGGAKDAIRDAGRH